MKEFDHIIKDPNGIHARPAGFLVQELQKFESTARIFKGDASCDGKKLFGLLKLSVKTNEKITVQIEGEDEDAACNAAKAFLEANM
ncbi:MAG: HPr family phosphocarrier protein [Spirochaetaceae bacterium]|jgi:phosphotransferase system HPr (HPr) family protein|nr:HPr family phosphocarrier protein [Spirochaetaceae bacterium]